MIARSEAIRLNRRVILCSSSDGATCSSAAGRWSGWLVFVDNNRNDSPESGEVLRTGMNGRLDTLQAAILLCKMDLFAQELKTPFPVSAKRLSKYWDEHLRR